MHSAIRSLQFNPKASIGPRADGCDPVLTDGPGAAEWRAQNLYAHTKIERRADKHWGCGFDLPSAVSFYRSKFLDCLTGAVANSYPNVVLP